jgi:DNA-binding LytR/AlgR family response regulator
MRLVSTAPRRSLYRLCGWMMLCCMGLAFSQTSNAEPRLRSVAEQDAIVCPAKASAQPADFTAPECAVTAFYEIDPQDRALWVRTTISLPADWLDGSAPMGLFVFAKSSSEVYVNGQFVGRNGTPSVSAADEFPGKIDAAFYLPPALLKPSNEVVLYLSSHHGFLQLARPVHFVGIGDFLAPETIFQRHTFFSMALLGALVLSILYFVVLRYQSKQPREHSLFLLMASLVAAQLFAESLRGLHSYSYPLHDLRLTVIWILSMAFGLCLLTFVARRFAKEHVWRWFALGSLATLLTTITVQSFDTKTALAILLPASCATALIAWESYRTRTRELAGYLVAFLAFDLVVLLTLNIFHNITYYLIVAAMTAYLFSSQARALNRERQLLLEEQQRVAKLSFRLDQLQQQETPSTIVASGAGEITHISTEHIRYCQAAGDYVELHLIEGRTQLYSGTLKGLESNLPNTFLRVHRSYIVNLEFVSTLKSLSNGGTLVLRDGEEIPVSRRVMPAVRGTLKDG